jgi:hypothetical protein
MINPVSSKLKIFSLDGREVLAPLRAGIYFVIDLNSAKQGRKRLLILR